MLRQNKNNRLKKLKQYLTIILCIVIGAVWTWNYFMYTELKTSLYDADQGNSISIQIIESEKEQNNDGVVESTDQEDEAAKTSASPSGIEQTIRDHWNDDTEDIAIAIAMAESSLNPRAYGDGNVGGSKGLFQINLKYNPQYLNTNLYDPQTNIQAAKEIYAHFDRSHGDGFRAWSTYKNGAYRKYL